MADISNTTTNQTGADKLAYFAASSSYDGPSNPLNQFRSYSYHFVLYLTDSTTNAEQLGSASADVDQYDQLFGRRDSHKSTNVDNYFDKYDIREYGGIKYITLINSFEDADLFIDDLQYTAGITALNNANNSQSRTDLMQAGLELTFKIFEPLGCRLLEIMSKAHSDLGLISPTYGLKIFFIGRRDEQISHGAANETVSGPDDIGYFYTVKPLLFEIMDISMNVSTNGTTYQLSVAPSTSGANTPLGKNLSGSATIDKKNPTLEDVCVRYIDSINDAMTRSKKYSDAAGNESLVPVEYAVEFIDVYVGRDENVKKHIKDSIVDNVTNLQRNETGIVVQPPIVYNLPSRISFIAQLCTELTSVPKGTNRLFTYAVTTKSETSPERIRYTIQVSRKKLTTVPVANSGSPADQAEKINDVAYDAYQDGRLLHYQYYFSGKNVDVIRYDLSVSIGLSAIFSTFTPSKPPDQSSLINKSNTNDSVVRSTNTEPSDTSPKVNLGVQTSPSASRNLRDPSSRDVFVQYMRSYMLGDNSSISTMSIRGNPKLLQSSISTPRGQSQQGQSNASQSSELDQKNVLFDQVLVKVDVFSPSRAWASTYTDSPLPATTFNESFWHGGLFHLVTVKSTFLNGTFTQDLMMRRVPTDENTPSIVRTTNESKGASGAASPRVGAGNQANASAFPPPSSDTRAQLGQLSAQYESGGRGSSAIGRDTNGGYSYGTYQIATKVGTFANYMAYTKKYYPDINRVLEEAGGNAGATAGTPQFQSAWRSLSSDPNFSKSQHNFIKATHYDILASRLVSATGVDLSRRSNGLQDVAWSVAVHHGPYSDIVANAITKVGAGASDKTIINAIYDDRSRVNVHFASSTERERQAVRNRFDRERVAALGMVS